MAEDTTQGGQTGQGGASGDDNSTFDPIAAEAFFKDLIGRYNTDDNQIILDLVSFHPLTQFEEKDFVDLLEHSLSLSVSEKKRVVDAIPTLSQYQIDELKKVFTEEREEFRKLMPKEAETIKKLVTDKRAEWKQLKQIYIDELKNRQKSNEDQNKIDDLKKSLGLEEEDATA
ncbi:MAG: hypothetical protein WC753_02630 [Candidatus Gracilibacteria bacterium]|jgi:hypothetical protein